MGFYENALLSSRRYNRRLLLRSGYDMSALVISLDFELFWGVTDSKTIENYGANVEGVWQSVPGILKLFKEYGIHATWATVGMLMCKDYKQWCDLRPSVMPTYR